MEQRWESRFSYQSPRDSGENPRGILSDDLTSGREKHAENAVGWRVPQTKACLRWQMVTSDPVMFTESLWLTNAVFVTD